MCGAAQTINVSLARKKYGIDYPTMYATKEHIDGKKCKSEADVMSCEIPPNPRCNHHWKR
jgi:hypothetical protein